MGKSTAPKIPGAPATLAQGAQTAAAMAPPGQRPPLMGPTTAPAPVYQNAANAVQSTLSAAAPLAAPQPQYTGQVPIYSNGHIPSAGGDESQLYTAGQAAAPAVMNDAAMTQYQNSPNGAVSTATGGTATGSTNPVVPVPATGVNYGAMAGARQNIGNPLSRQGTQQQYQYQKMQAMISRGANADQFAKAGYDMNDPRVQAALAKSNAQHATGVQNYIQSLQGAGAGDAARDVTSDVLAHNPNATAADKALVAKYNAGGRSMDLSNPNGVSSGITQDAAHYGLIGDPSYQPPPTTVQPPPGATKATPENYYPAGTHGAGPPPAPGVTYAGPPEGAPGYVPPNARPTGKKPPPPPGRYTRMAQNYNGYIPNTGPLNQEYTSSGT